LEHLFPRLCPIYRLPSCDGSASLGARVFDGLCGPDYTPRTRVAEGVRVTVAPKLATRMDKVLPLKPSEGLPMSPMRAGHRSTTVPSTAASCSGTAAAAAAGARLADDEGATKA